MGDDTRREITLRESRLGRSCERSDTRRAPTVPGRRYPQPSRQGLRRRLVSALAAGARERPRRSGCRVFHSLSTSTGSRSIDLSREIERWRPAGSERVVVFAGLDYGHWAIERTSARSKPSAFAVAGYPSSDRGSHDLHRPISRRVAVPLRFVPDRDRARRHPLHRHRTLARRRTHGRQHQMSARCSASTGPPTLPQDARVPERGHVRLARRPDRRRGRALAGRPADARLRTDDGLELAWPAAESATARSSPPGACATRAQAGGPAAHLEPVDAAAAGRVLRRDARRRRGRARSTCA